MAILGQENDWPWAELQPMLRYLERASGEIPRRHSFDTMESARSRWAWQRMFDATTELIEARRAFLDALAGREIRCEGHWHRPDCAGQLGHEKGAYVDGDADAIPAALSVDDKAGEGK